MSGDYSNYYLVKEKGYRDGVYGHITTTVSWPNGVDIREEKFTSIEVINDEPKNIDTKKIAEEIEEKAKKKNGELP